MPLIKLNELEIDFPFEPYNCQLEYMSKVIECLQNSKHGILESPTGTGKTLCLLCATLAWQDYMKKNFHSYADEIVINHKTIKQKKLWNKMNNDAPQARIGNMIPKIIYSSRTHSQLNQCMNALKRTPYANRKVGMIASRDQLCIHPKVSNLESNSCKIYACKSRVKHRSCHFYNKFESIREDITEDLKILDIEDLVMMGKTKSICPYFLSRDMLESADIIFMPYNYLLDSRIRRIYNIDLENSVIIFDEAHNVEQVCEDIASVELTSISLAASIEELKALGDYLFESGTSDTTQELASDKNLGNNKELNINEILLLKQNLIKLEDELHLSNAIWKNEDMNTGITKPVEFLFSLLDRCGFNFSNNSEYINLIDDTVSFISTNNSNSHVLPAVGVKGLEKIVSFLRTVFTDDILEFNSDLQNKLSSCYRIYIQDKEISTGSAATKNKFSWVKKSNVVLEKNRILSYWCLSPGITMNQLANCGVRSIILTSGTLYPIETMKVDMDINIEVELRNSHIINPDQMLVSVCTKGPDGESLNSSYETREKLNYTNSLGNTIANLAQIIPRGLLVVFPSYGLMKKCIDRWESNEIYNKITVEKQLILEPQDKIKFGMAMEQFHNQNNDSDSSKGAILFAVARGKVSEGLDLSDHQGRGVIVVGLPYPPMMDPRIRLKMSFLDDRLEIVKAGISGRAWYRQQAYRSVNQSVGRVIRHSRDFGAVILCDERFASADSRSQLPLWMQPNISICNKFDDIIENTKKFFKSVHLKYPPLFVEKEEITDTLSSNPMIINISKKNEKSAGSLNLDVPFSSKVFSFSSGLKGMNDEISKAIQIYTEIPESKSLSKQKTEKMSLMDILNKAEHQFLSSSLMTAPIKRSLPEENIQESSLEVKPPPIKVKKYRLVESKEIEKGGSTEYFNTIKELFVHDQEGLQRYKNAIKIFKVDLNVDTLFSCISSLLCEKDRPGLVAEFCKFIKPEFQERFENLCKYVLGLECKSEQKQCMPKIDEIKDTNSMMNCVSCLAAPAVDPLGATCKHICCFKCWKSIIESENGTRRCPKCQIMVRRRNLTRIKLSI